MARKDELGRRGEQVAADWLEGLGYRVVDRNWRCPTGELDLVLRQGRTLVFAEVKTRSSLEFGHPFEAITSAKSARLRRLAAHWCREHAPAAADVRIDAVAVTDAWSERPLVEHLTGIV
ncbi:YraN family protein [Leifsonia sp. C5G2]|uniref:YraN family protein n=1 Tax=Leifsonia sp. C5G2 TaxID=2735269 RepID=UPI001584C447|nr:YraN family protein [Leifsonia sp. C5G2]NUU06742.1 YraN family protein [Leifsonia sp. C5G2]